MARECCRRTVCASVDGQVFALTDVSGDTVSEAIRNANSIAAVLRIQCERIPALRYAAVFNTLRRREDSFERREWLLFRREFSGRDIFRMLERGINPLEVVNGAEHYCLSGA